MHAFRLVGELLQYVRVSSELHSNFPCLPEPSLMYNFMLARIDQTIAVPAREKFASAVEQCDAAPTVSTSGIDGTDKPGTTTTEVTLRPSNWHALFDGFPLAVLPVLRAEHQNYCIRFGAHADAAKWLSESSPRKRKVLACKQPSLTMPAAHVYPSGHTHKDCPELIGTVRVVVSHQLRK